MLIGQKQTPLSTRTVKEVRSLDGLDRIKLIEYKVDTPNAIITNTEVLNYKDGMIFQRFIYRDEGEGLDKYQELLFVAFSMGKRLIDSRGRFV